MAADNRSLTQVGLELHRRGLKTLNGKEWRRQVISRILKNPFYKGYIQYSGEYHKGNHPPIVDEKLWERANKILSARLPGHNFVQKERFYEYLLAGILRCGDCGSHMVCNFSGGRDRRKFFYYECSRSKQALGCKASRISATTFDKAIINYFKRAAKDRSIIIKALGDAMLESQAKLEKIDADLKERETKLNGFRFQANKLLELAIGNAVTKGSTYKDKMAELETEIAKLEDEIDKLQAQKRVASINACSGELVYRTMGFAIQHLEDAPPEAQKSLIQALIKDIYVYSDRLVINMYIEEPLEGILPGEIASTNEKRPTDLSAEALAKAEACKALVATASLPSVSDSCQQWLPVLDASRSPEHEYVTLLVKLYRHRKRGFVLSLNRPLPPKKVRPKRIYQNIILESLKLQSFIKNSHTRMTWAKASKELQISDSKIAHLLKIINKLPPDFVENMRSCTDETTLKAFTGRRLLSISRLKTEKERQTVINRLLTKV